MKSTNPEFDQELEALLQKHGLEDRIYHADALGQFLGRTGCIGVDAEWAISGMMAAYARKNNVAEHLKKMVEAVVKARGENEFNYNDLDCDMWGKTIRKQNECLECDSLLSKIFKKEPPLDGVCPRCKGSKIDPESHDDGWFLVWDNHGNGTAFILWETCIGFELHIRRLVGNKSDKERVKTLKKLVEEVPKGIYETDYKLIRYRDQRDDGFILSMSLDKNGNHQNCHSTIHAHYELSTIVEHFPCVIEEIEGSSAHNV